MENNKIAASSATEKLELQAIEAPRFFNSDSSDDDEYSPVVISNNKTEKIITNGESNQFEPQAGPSRTMREKSPSISSLVSESDSSNDDDEAYRMPLFYRAVNAYAVEIFYGIQPLEPLQNPNSLLEYLPADHYVDLEPVVILPEFLFEEEEEAVIEEHRAQEIGLPKRKRARSRSISPSARERLRRRSREIREEIMREPIRP